MDLDAKEVIQALRELLEQQTYEKVLLALQVDKLREELDKDGD